MDVDMTRYELRAALEGCGDNSCMIRKPSGAGTNGGCRCFGERSTFKKVAYMAEQMRRLLDESERAAYVRALRWAASKFDRKSVFGQGAFERLTAMADDVARRVEVTDVP